VVGQWKAYIEPLPERVEQRQSTRGLPIYWASQRAESLYELLLHLNLNTSHLDEAREAYVRRLGLR
jgi:hypothetical protein